MSSASFSPLTRTAIKATLHCLTGCAIGEVLGMVIATAANFSNALSIGISVALAFVFGYSFTFIPVVRAGITARRAVAVTLAADTVSIATMELTDNAGLLFIPGALDATLSDILFWASLAATLLVAFVVTVPVNRALIARGKGHAIAHQAH